MAFLDWISSIVQSGNVTSGPAHRLQSQSIQAKILNDPYYRFQSLEEVRLAASWGVRIDVNQASVDDWLRLPGISIHQARSLAELTQAGVQFCCIEDLAAALSIPALRLKPLSPILSFCYYDPESVAIMQRINPNTASVEKLIQIPVVDLFLARAIAQNRTSLGPYRDLADFQRRLSLPSQLTSELMHYLQF